MSGTQGPEFRAVLEARNLHVGFGGVRAGVPPIRAVDGVDLAIGKGQIVALAGESGCGKTTLARTMLGLQRQPVSARAFRRAAPAGRHRRSARAGAEVIIADEPVSSLDASVRGEILALLLSLRDELGLTVLVVTHDLGLAWNIADRLAVMYLGRIVEIGQTEEVLAAPRHPYTEALLSVLPETRHVEQIILVGETPDPRRIPRGWRFHPRCPVLADGRAAAAGCVSEPLAILPATAAHQAACLLELRADEGVGAAASAPNV